MAVDDTCPIATSRTAPVPECDAMSSRALIPYRWEMILLLWCAFFLNQADRNVYNTVLPMIQESLELSSTDLGLVVTVFTWTYAALVPVAGYAGDVLRRKWIICLSLLFWSATTVFTGVSSCLAQLIVFRGLATGGGEAFYYPSANSLIGQIHHRTRAVAMAIHQTANYTGIIASGYLAAMVAEQWGWRASFATFGVAGMALAVVLMIRLEDTPQATADSGSQPSPARIPLRVAAAAILEKRTAWMLCLAFAGHLVANLGYLTWMPTFLHQKFDLSLSNAGFSSMFYHHVAAMLGVLVGGKLSDRWAVYRRKARFEVELAGLVLGIVPIYFIGTAQSLTGCLAASAVFGLFRGVYDSNLFVALFEVIEPRLRSSAVGVMLATAFALGAISPTVVGWLKEHYSFDLAISSLSLGYLFGAVCMAVALYCFLAKDLYHEPSEETVS